MHVDICSVSQSISNVSVLESRCDDFSVPVEIPKCVFYDAVT